MSVESDSAIIESVRAIAEAEIPKYQSDKFYNSVPLKLFKTFAENGIVGSTVDSKYGGLSLGADIFSRVIEEIASVDLGVAVFISVHSMVAGLVQKFGSETTKQQLLPKFTGGQILGAFALTEPGAGSDAAAIKTRAEKHSESDYVLNGEKCYITSAGFADIYLVFAKTEPEAKKDGISAFLVSANSDGLSCSAPEKKMGAYLSPIASVNFYNVNISDSHLLGSVNKGYAVALEGLAGGRINIAAAAIGVARKALKIALSHASERKQFGQSIANFQGIQFMLADMKTKLEAAKLLTYDAAALLTNHPQSRENRIKASMAKCFATDAAMEITTDAVQILGGAGYISDYQVEQLMRDAKMLQIVEGTNQIQRAVIAKELLS